METEKNNLPSISNSEWKVMELLWNQSPMTSHEIISALQATTWSPQTIKTLIFRLQKKGAISFEKSRREHEYSPLVQRDSYIKKESKSLVDKLFGGATGPMITHFLKSERISAEELKNIKSLIESMEDENDI